MWIVPKTLNISPSALVMEESTSGSSELSDLFARSVMWRSKPSPSRTWSRRLKTDSSTRLLSLRILNDSTGLSSLEKWISSLGASPVSRSPKLDEELEMKTPDISSPISSKGSESSDLPLFSLRTSRGSSQPSSEETAGETPKGLPFSSMSAENWNEWVSRSRLECSQRAKSELLTRERGSSSSDAVLISVPRVSTSSTNSSEGQNISPEQLIPEGGERAPSLGSPPESPSASLPNWATPTTRDFKGAYSEESQKNKPRNLLPDQVKLWTTISARDHYDAKLKGPMSPRKDGTPRFDQLPRQVLHQENYTAPLNPRWVEALMGVPIGWTLPSCSRPLRAERTSSEPSGTESSPMSLREPSESSGEN